MNVKMGCLHLVLTAKEMQLKAFESNFGHQIFRHQFGPII